MSTYVALGDSFTAGNGIGVGRRWPDLLAADLAGSRADFKYVNLGCDGADSQAVLETVPPALELRPDLVTLICGANDVLLRPRPDVTGFRRRFERILNLLQKGIPGVAILTSNYPDGWALPQIGPRTRQRLKLGLRAINQAILEISLAHGVACLDAYSNPKAREPGNLSADGLHPSALGHRRAAREYAEALRHHFGIAPDQRRITA